MDNTWIRYLKTYFKIILLTLFLSVSVIYPSYAILPEEIPQLSNPQQNHIVDVANILDKDIEGKIDNAIAILQRKKNKTIYIVTVPTISHESTKQKKQKFKIIPTISETRRFLESILLSWNIKSLKEGNAVLILINQGDRSIEIRSAYNLRYILQDRHVQGIIDKIIVPEFKNKNFNQGILSATKAIIKKIDNPYYNSLPTPKNKTWQEKQILECQARDVLSPYGETYYNCPKEISYHGGGGNW